MTRTGFRTCQTSRIDQHARTPAWLLRYLTAAFGPHFDPAPAGGGLDGLRIPWASVNYVNPPFAQAAAFLDKACAETARGSARHTVFLLPVAKFHCAYFARIFDCVRAVQVLSENVAFAGYATRLPHALALVHIGPATPASLAAPAPAPAPDMRLVAVPSLDAVDDMLAAAGYPHHRIGHNMTAHLLALFGDAPPARPCALVLPARLDARWVRAHVLRQATAILFCSGTLRPCDGAPYKLWSGSMVVVYDDARAPRRYAQWPGVSAHALPLHVLAVEPLRPAAAGRKGKPDGRHRNPEERGAVRRAPR